MELTPQSNVPLSQHSTMRLGGPAKYLIDITSPSQIEPALRWAEQQKCKFIMIGGGSNIGLQIGSASRDRFAGSQRDIFRNAYQLLRGNASAAWWWWGEHSLE